MKNWAPICWHNWKDAFPKWMHFQRKNFISYFNNVWQPFKAEKLGAQIIFLFLNGTKSECRNWSCHGFNIISSRSLDETRFEPTTFQLCSLKTCCTLWPNYFPRLNQNWVQKINPLTQFLTSILHKTRFEPTTFRSCSKKSKSKKQLRRFRLSGESLNQFWI